MTQMEIGLEQGKRIDEWYDYLMSTFKTRYCYFNFSDEVWFLNQKKRFVFHLNKFTRPLYGFIMEYADSIKDTYSAEDGDQFSIVNYETPNDLYMAMLNEIEHD